MSTFSRTLLVAVLLLGFATTVARAEDYGPDWVSVLDSRTGSVIGCYRGANTFPPSLRPFMSRVQARESWPLYQGPANYPTGTFHGRRAWVCRFYRTPRGRDVAFLSFNGSWQVRGDLDGVIAAIDHAGMRVRFAPPQRFHIMFGDKAIFVTPSLALVRQYALIDNKTRLRCYDMDRGQRMWTLPVSLEEADRCGGALIARDAMYLSTMRGLGKVDLSSGRLLWLGAPVGNHVDYLEQGAHSRLYVHGYEAPPFIRRELEKAAERHYGHYGTRYIEPTVIVPQGTRIFGYVVLRARPVAAIWEYARGRWRRLFDCPPDAVDSPALERLFTQHGISPAVAHSLREKQ